jgi:anti-sigma regulatory factor (Ser/Thr protein kinase)
MVEASLGAPPLAFIRGLLLRGTPMLALPPDQTPDHTVPAMERLADSLVVRAFRFAMLIPLLYRVAAFPKVLTGFIVSNGSLGLASVLGVSIPAVALNIVAVVRLLRGRGTQTKLAGRIVVADLAVGLLVNLVVAVTAPVSVQPFAIDVAWTWLVGTITLWTLSFGVPAAIVLLVAAAPLRVLLTWAGGDGVSQTLAVNRGVGGVVALAVAIVTAGGALILVGVGTRFALGIGIGRGRDAERLHNQRVLHDSVLQTLEAMGTETPGDDEQAAERLREMRVAARAQAAELRRALIEPAFEEPSAGLAADLATLATEMTREGLRTDLVAAASITKDSTLPEPRRAAMREAVREALRNTVKHAGTTQVVLRMEERDGGITVIARDHGQGFSVQDRPAGFGISQSIVARLAEVGGRGTIDSSPGNGTRVTLWVPR